jgi:hypothetical protein
MVNSNVSPRRYSDCENPALKGPAEVAVGDGEATPQLTRKKTNKMIARR